MQKKIIKKVKILVVIAIIVGFVWFLVVYPMISFHKNEKMLENAARNYFDLNKRELPTGERVKTVSLKTLYHKAFLEKDVLVPYSKKTCSLDQSWVKVRRENGEYKYYVYLECGVLSSNVDHRGPEIKLNGDSSITVSRGEEYKELGVKSVVDNNDGKLKTDDVTIKGSVDTSKIGTYEISYIAFDNLSNKTTVTRKVEVVQKLYNTVKPLLNGSTNFTGNPEGNYVRLSNILFRIYGVDNNKNVILVTDQDISNVNHSKVDKWLNYFYDHLNESTQKMIVPTKYCNMALTETTLDTTQCSSYTDKKKVYIPSVIEVNKAASGEDNFMKPNTMSWVANPESGSKKAYLTRNVFYYDQYGKDFLSYDVKENYGVRPMMTIKGDSLILDGTGVIDDPFTFGDVKKAKGGSYINERSTGEYLDISGVLYRIIDTLDDGTTKVVSVYNIGDYKEVLCGADSGEDVITYNPKNEFSNAYYINNRASEFVDTSYFTKHEISVPIYKKQIIYGEEESTKKYTVVLSAPNMYEMFSAHVTGSTSFWYLNTSKGKRITGAVYDVGVPVNEKIDEYEQFGIRVVGFLKKNVVISSGNGTEQSPYLIR